MDNTQPACSILYTRDTPPTYARGFRKHRYRDQPEEIPSVSSRRRMQLDGFEDPRGESDGWPRLKLITTFCLPSSASTLPNEPIPLPFLGGVHFYSVWWLTSTLFLLNMEYVYVSNGMCFFPEERRRKKFLRDYERGIE